VLADHGARRAGRVHGRLSLQHLLLPSFPERGEAISARHLVTFGLGGLRGGRRPNRASGHVPIPKATNLPHCTSEETTVPPHESHEA